MSFAKAKKTLEHIRKTIPDPDAQQFEWNLALALQQMCEGLETEMARLNKNLEAVYKAAKKR